MLYFSFSDSAVQQYLWAEDQPNNYNGQQNCIVLDGGRRWLWNDVTCDLDYLPWVCQYSKCCKINTALFQYREHQPKILQKQQRSTIMPDISRYIHTSILPKSHCSDRMATLAFESISSGFDYRMR